MKAVVLDGYTLNPGDLSWENLASICELRVYDRTPNELILNRIDDADIVITNKTRISKEIIDLAPNIKYIGILATGYNVVDIQAAKERNIPVTNIPGYSTMSVAQHVFALLLEICVRVSDHSDAVKKGDWSSHADFCFWNYPLIELSGKTLGIIGFGSIGQAVSKIANSFGMSVVVYSRTIKKECEHDLLQFVNLNELYQLADIITLHAPLNEDTKGMINQQAISQMKNGVILINTSRGALVVEKDLYDGLESGKIYAAGVDVATVEPINIDSPLLKAKNIYITPHIAWAPIETRNRLLSIAVENVKAFINHNYVNVVNDVT